MTSIVELQQWLAKKGFYKGQADGQFGAISKEALWNALEAGPDTPMTADNIAFAAKQIGTGPAEIRTVWKVEANGAGFFQGLPKILFEGHIFSKLTGGQYDRTHPGISYPKWDKSKYPATQKGRYLQLLEAVALNPDAAFSAASWGAFQIMGQNFAMCGYASPLEFAYAMCDTEGAQLTAFIAFVRAKHLDDELRNHQWALFAKGYNGTAYRDNNYDGKLAAQFAIEKGR